MINPFRNQQKLPQPLISARDKARMWVMCALFVMVLGTFLWMRSNVVSPEAAREARERARGGQVGQVDVAPQMDAQGRPIFKYTTETPEERRDLVRDEMLQRLTDLVRTGRLLDSSAEDDPAVISYLLDVAFADYRVLAVPPAFHERLDPAKVLFEPGPHRGRFASAFGRVLTVEEPRDFTREVNGQQKTDRLYAATFESDDGALYRVFGPHPVGFEPGQWMQVYGVFYRTGKVERQGVPQDVLFLVLPRAPQKAYEPVTVEKIDPAWAAEVRERNFEEANGVDERPFWLTLNYVKNLGIEGYEALKAEPGFAIRDFGALARDLVRTPQEHRFSFVSATGRIIDSVVDYPESDNPGKIDRLWFAVLLQPQDYLVRIVSVRPWSEWGVHPEGEYVRLEGIFYKAWQYVPRRGGDALMIPLLVVTGAYVEGRQSSAGLNALGAIVAVLGIALIVLFIVVSLRNRSGLLDYRERIRRQREERSKARAGAAQAAAEGSGPAPPTDPAPPSDAPPPAAPPPEK